MRRLCSLSLVLAVVLFHSSASAGKYNLDRNIGDAAPVWQDLPGVDGRNHSLSDLKDKAVIVVAFTCNSCPYAADYEERLIQFAKKHSGEKSPVGLVAINVNKVAEDALPAMKERAKEKQFSFPYLYDESQQIAREFGAARTPEFFVLNKERQIVYMGAMDDNPDESQVSKRYVDDAVQAALDGKAPAIAETKAIGCAVRYVRVRAKK